MTTEAPPCVHHDRIAPPEGPVSIGRCKYCGREKEYANFRWPDYNKEPLNEPVKVQQERAWDE
jgi:hypothetical protein